MNEEPIESLIQGYLVDRLSDEEKADLAGWLDEDAGHGATFRETVELEYTLGAQLKGRTSIGDEEKREKLISFPAKNERWKHLGTAAVLLLSAALAWLFLGAPTETLADVTKAMDEVRYVRWKQVEINKNVDSFLGVDQVEQRQTVYFDLRDHRSRTETHYPTGTFVTIQDDKLGKRMVLNPQNQTATLTESTPDETLEPLRHPFEAVMKAADVKISRVKLNGVEHGFVALDDENNGVAGTTKIWLDLKTLLPVRAEYALPDLKLWYTMTEFEWTNQLANAETLFRIEAPGTDAETGTGTLKE